MASGIHNSGTATVTGSRIVGNCIGLEDAACNPVEKCGGGIYNTGNFTIKDSEVSGNRAYEGGNLYNDGRVILINSTIPDGIYNRGTIETVP